uniref:Lipase maturation factor n=1 Tax=Electrophorus electricus TaxID=8005 RepID=A0A4W4E956_ELEEL
MGDVRVPRQLFLRGVAVAYLCAFASLYIQIPGLYGDEGILPARLLVAGEQKPLLQQLQESPSLLWLVPSLGLGPQQGLELICLLGALLSLGAVLLGALRDSLAYLCLWILYLSLYTAGGDFLHTECDSLLLEVGFLAFLVAPCGLLRSSTSPGLHDPVTFWLTRWLLFRLVLCTGLSKLASSDPCWWDLTALSRYYETQASPTPLAWYAHQLPDWLSRLGAVCVMASEIAVPLLMFFAPVRGLRICGFYIQVFLQLCLVLLGGCSLTHLLSVVLSFSLLDDDCFSGCTHQKKKPKSKTWSQFLLSCLALLVKLAVYVLILLGTIKLFKLEINWDGSFLIFVSLIQAPTIWVGVLSLTWEAVVTMLRCACVRGIMGKLCALTQWAIFTATTVAVFTLSLVPYTAVAGVSAGKIFREVQNAYGAVEKYQLVSAYGIQHRMVPPAGRPEVIIEGSGDKKTWKELSFMHKPSSVSEAPPVLGPHKPRLDWLLWEAARADYQHSHWFTGLVQQLLLGKQDVLRLLQVDEAQYPFRVSPPAFLRASVYHYHFTQTGQDGNQPREWWKRLYVREFFPAVHLGDPVLEELLQEAGLKEKFPVLPISDTPLAQALSVLRGHARGHSGPLVLLTLFTTVASILLLKDLVSRSRTPKGPKPKSKPATSEHKSKKPREAHPEASEKNRGPSGRGGRKEGLEERRIDSDRSPRKRK